MPLLKITGIDIPTPSDYSVSLLDLSKAERNTRGGMITERIRGDMRKLELSWKYLSPEDVSTVLDVVSTVAFEVVYLDPRTNSFQTRTFYAGDRNVGALDYINGVIRWKDIKFNIVEK